MTCCVDVTEGLVAGSELSHLLTTTTSQPSLAKMSGHVCRMLVVFGGYQDHECGRTAEETSQLRW